MLLFYIVILEVAFHTRFIQNIFSQTVAFHYCSARQLRSTVLLVFLLYFLITLIRYVSWLFQVLTEHV